MKHDRNEYVMHNPINRAPMAVRKPAPRKPFNAMPLLQTLALIIIACALVRIAA